MLLNKFTWIFRMIIFNLFLLYSMGFWCYKTIQSNAIFDVVTFNATRAKAWNVIFILWTSIHPLLRKFFLGKVRPSQFYQRSFILAAQVLSDHCYLWDDISKASNAIIKFIFPKCDHISRGSAMTFQDTLDIGDNVAFKFYCNLSYFYDLLRSSTTLFYMVDPICT